MNLYSSLPSSSTSSSSTFTFFPPIQNVTVSSKTPTFRLPTKTSSSSNQTSQVLERSPRQKEPLETEPLEGVTLVSRPVLDIPGEEEEEEEKWERKASTVIIDAGLEEFAKKMPIFEPGRGSRPCSLAEKPKPLLVNLDLALYKAKILGKSFKFKEAQEMLEKCISYWPEDGRAYVALGKIRSKQSRMAEARAVYEKGCQATQGENPYIWQCWAVLENKMGNIRRARELFDAATVADKGHIAAWHGWAVLELKQGNMKKARQLLAKGVKFGGGNEYIYQTLALLEAKANRYEQACFLFKQATKCNPRSCASWLAWAQLEMQKENNSAARKLFEKAIVASPKNRFAWHVWGLFEANAGNIDKARKLLKIGHALNPRDPVLLQSLALLEYKHSSANLARASFRKASELDPRHQPVWIAWGWMEWKEGNLSRARELYERALSIDSTSESAARCLQAWGVLEQRIGNLSAARRLFRSSLNIDSQSYITWMTWAQLEEDQGNSVRAEEIRNLYFQQRTEVVDDPSWVAGFLDIIDPAIDSIKRLMNLDQNPFKQEQDTLKNLSGFNNQTIARDKSTLSGNSEGNVINTEREFDLDSFIKERLSLDPTKLDINPETSSISVPTRAGSSRRTWRNKTGNNPR